jgi:cysteine desulfurase family protein (TIGR01976 family)
MDNPGGTQVPQMVIDAMVDCLIHANANLSGGFSTSERADAIVAGAHGAMADFLNAASPREIIIGQNMTTLTFHISRSLGRLFAKGDEIIVTKMDHDANVSPWLLLARDHGLEVKFLPFDRESYEFDMAELDRLLSPRTKLVAFNHASNLTGTINDVKAVVERAHGVGALVYVDSVQFAPHGVIDVQDLECDFLVCSPYKFYGPHMGVLWGREDLLMELEPYKLRPAADSLPDRFETGTLSHEGMAGITATVDYFAGIGRDLAGGLYLSRYAHFTERRRNLCAALDYLTDYENSLMRRLVVGLAALPGVKIQGITNPNAMNSRVTTISFTAQGHHPRAIAEALGKLGIQVWDGHNYAVEPVKHLGLMAGGGVVRVGLAHYNTMEEVNITVAAVAAQLGV